MLKASDDSSKMRALMRRAEAAGVTPNEVSFTMLLNDLLREGRDESAAEVQREMADRGIEPNEQTIRTGALERMLEKGETAITGRIDDLTCKADIDKISPTACPSYLYEVRQCFFAAYPESHVHHDQSSQAGRSVQHRARACD